MCLREQPLAELGHLGDGTLAVERSREAVEERALLVAGVTGAAGVHERPLGRLFLVGQRAACRAEQEPCLRKARIVPEPLEYRDRARRLGAYLVFGRPTGQLAKAEALERRPRREAGISFLLGPLDRSRQCLI